MTGAGTNTTLPRPVGGPAIILVRPQLAVNIGMCARAMANFGLSDLRLVAPRNGWPRVGDHEEDGIAAAAGGAYILEGARVFATLAEAVADLSFVWATTARERGQKKRVVTPAVALPETVAGMALGEHHGILFGPERTGLDSEEVVVADAIVTFPVNPAYASLNLAQAVLLMGYEWRRASDGGVAPHEFVDRSPPAPRGAILSFFEYIEAELDRAGFFRPPGKAPIMRRNLRNIFHRMAMTEQDLRTLRGAITRLVTGPRREAAAVEAAKREAGDAGGAGNGDVAL